MTTDIYIVKSQVGIDDDKLIEDELERNKGDVIATIMNLSNIQAATPRLVHCDLPQTQHQQHMENVRQIMDEKEQVFFEVFQKRKQENT